jgi:hypothetical protein
MATTTPNFGWSVPTSTDYVKDGAVAIETLGDAVDARFGDVTNYPNQIVNRVSGVSRPIPYAMNAQVGSLLVNASGSGDLVFTFPASRFSQPPIVTLGTNTGTTNINSGFRIITVTSSAATIRINNNTASNNTYTVYMMAVQMTSATAAG